MNFSQQVLGQNTFCFMLQNTSKNICWRHTFYLVKRWYKNDQFFFGRETTFTIWEDLNPLHDSRPLECFSFFFWVFIWSGSNRLTFQSDDSPPSTLGLVSKFEKGYYSFCAALDVICVCHVLSELWHLFLMQFKFSR